MDVMAASSALCPLKNGAVARRLGTSGAPGGIDKSELTRSRAAPGLATASTSGLSPSRPV